MNELPLVLALDVAGTPGRWINYEQSAYYYSKGSVAWSMSPVEFTLRGGTNARTGKQSTLSINTIIAIRGRINGKHNQFHDHIPPLSNKSLFRRDRNICAYCGMSMRNVDLTRDHVTPRAQDGRNIWTNVVTACASCNKHKDNRTPEQAGMQLLYIPYTPNRAEWLILENRNILTDQMAFLLKKVPKNSRLHLE
jgi:5-methylcytosine-specific restriction endonuclease McrA